MEALEGLEARLVRGAYVEAIAFEGPEWIGIVEVAEGVWAVRGLEAAAASGVSFSGSAHTWMK